MRHDSGGNLAYHVGWAFLPIMFAAILLAWRSRGRPHQTVPLLNPSYLTLFLTASGIVMASGANVALDTCQAGSPLLVILLLATVSFTLLNQAIWFFNPPATFHTRSARPRDLLTRLARLARRR